jgi:hypothetical protein
MSGEAVLKPDKDYSSEVDKLLPEAEVLAKVPIDIRSSCVAILTYP